MLDNYDSFTQMLVSYFRELGVRMDTYENDGIDAKTVRDMDDAGLLRGIVVSPGPKSPKECGNCGDIVRLAARRRIPWLGVCLGHQVIADVFGARVTRGKRPMHGKVTAIRHNNQGLFKALPETFEVVRYHSLVVDDDELPHFFSVDARSEDGAIMALRHRELPLYGVQFHPEAARTQYGHELLSRFVVCCETAREGDSWPRPFMYFASINRFLTCSSWLRLCLKRFSLTPPRRAIRDGSLWWG